MRASTACIYLFGHLVLPLTGISDSLGETFAHGPSFDCAHVTSQVNRMICASPELSALDRQLAEHYEATLHQGGIDTEELRSGEARWLRDTRNACASSSCLEDAYLVRDAAILERSLRAASPAAYEDTRPFPVPSDAFDAARQYVGSSLH